MIEFSFLLFVLLFLYFLECCVWVPSGSFAFRLPSSRERPVKLLTNPRTEARPKVVFEIPFSVRGGVVVCSPSPLMVSPQGIAVDSRLTKAAWQNCFMSFEGISQIEAVDRDLFVNGATFVSMASDVQAAGLATFLTKVRNAKPEDRFAQIEREIARSLSVDGVSTRLQMYTENVLELSTNSLLLFAAIFLISPVVVHIWGLAAAWPFLLAYLVLIASLTVWDFRRVDRVLFPGVNISRWKPIVTMLLSPPAAMHAKKYLARDLGWDCQPLAIAAARSSDEDLQRLASWVLRETGFRRERNPNTSEPAADCIEWYCQRLQSAVSTVVRRRGLDPNAIIAPPPRESQRVQSYCPRCLSQYVISEGVCHDCEEIPLRPFSKFV